MTEIVPNRRVW